MFRKADRERLEQVQNGLISLTGCVAFRADIGLLKQQLDTLTKAINEITWKLVVPTTTPTLSDPAAIGTPVGEAIASLAESQGKLLAALNELPTRDQMIACVTDAARRTTALSGQLKGLGDGLAEEIRKVREDLLAAKMLKSLAPKPPRPAKRGKRAAPRSR